MSEAERVPRGGRPGALKQTKGHQEETIRDHWAELVLGAGDSDDMPSELTDIAEALQKHNPEMTVTNTQVQESWRRFCTKNPQLLEPDETTAPAAAESSQLPAKPSRKPFKRLLILAAALALLLSLFTVQASGFDLFRTLAEWTASVLRIGNDAPAQITMGENDLAEGEVRAYETPEDMLADLHIRGDVLPTWIPERFSLQLCEATKNEAGTSFRVVYASGDECLAVRIWQISGDDAPLIEKDRKDVLRLVVNGVEHYIFYDGESGMEKVVWSSGDCGCRITGNVSQAELERMIKSIGG